MLDRLVKTDQTEIEELVHQFIEYCDQSRGQSPSTIKTRKTHLKQFAQYCTEKALLDVSQLTPTFIDDYFTEYQKCHSKSTTNTGRRIMKVFLRWLSGYKEMQLNTTPEAIQLVRQPQTLPQALNDEDVHRVVLNTKHPQDGLTIALMYESGIRIKELCDLKVGDIDFDSIHIRGKGEIDRIVYITDKLANKIQDFIHRHEKHPDMYLFCNVVCANDGWGEKLTTNTARLRIQKAFKKEGVDMHPHQLRHTFAINLLQAGCDIVTIQNLLGHKYITTTQTYLRVSNNYLRGEYRKYIKSA